jgi:hypothetical protein
MEVIGQLHTPTALLPGKSPGSRWLGGWVDPELVWTTWRKFLTLQGLKLHPLVVHPVASRYTDYVIPAPTPSIEDSNFVQNFLWPD